MRQRLRTTPRSHLMWSPTPALGARIHPCGSPARKERATLSKKAASVGANPCALSPLRIVSRGNRTYLTRRPEVNPQLRNDPVKRGGSARTVGGSSCCGFVRNTVQRCGPAPVGFHLFRLFIGLPLRTPACRPGIEIACTNAGVLWADACEAEARRSGCKRSLGAAREAAAQPGGK